MHRSLKPLCAVVCLSWMLIWVSCSAPKEVTHSTQTTKEPVRKEPPRDEFVDTYSAKLGLKLDDTCNRKLIEVVSGWLGTPYKYGGTGRQGIDCSGFVSAVFLDVFRTQLERSSSGIFSQVRRIERKELAEGDLVFFKINSSKISHVGIYLRDGFFIHASTRRGVMVSRLDEPYYEKYFFAAGRVGK